jgi:hypothetical protein
MRNKLLIGMLMLMSAFVILPANSFAASHENTTTVTVNNSAPQIRVRIGPQRRNRNRNWRSHDNGRHVGWNNRTRLVQQVYYVRGHRYVRWVRVRY